MQLQDLNNVNFNTSNPQASFTQFEQDTYNQSLATISNLGAQNSATYAAYFQKLAGGPSATLNASTVLAAGAFASLSAAVNTVASYSVRQIIANLAYLMQQIGAQGGASVGGGLIQALRQVKSDFSGLMGANSTTAIQTWIQDTQPQDPGGFQQNLSNAVTSSQSFNDTERENLREVMFVYEEFYKSATGMLSSLDTLLKKMADAIAR
jgi:hypothetical protein